MIYTNLETELLNKNYVYYSTKGMNKGYVIYFTVSNDLYNVVAEIYVESSTDTLQEFNLTEELDEIAYNTYIKPVDNYLCNSYTIFKKDELVLENNNRSQFIITMNYDKIKNQIRR